MLMLGLSHGLLVFWAILTQVPLLSLDEATQEALARQPQIHIAEAQADVSAAVLKQKIGVALPQIQGSAAYTRTTANFVARPGSVPSSISSAPVQETNKGYNYYATSLTATQLLFDFGQAYWQYQAARGSHQADLATLQSTRATVILSVQQAFFNAWATRSLRTIAHQTLENQARHLAQTMHDVRVGIYPEINLAQARSDMANSRVQALMADNNYLLALSQLNVAIGRTTPKVYDVTDETLPEVQGETGDNADLLTTALAARPDVLAQQALVLAQQALVDSAIASYAPLLQGTGTLSDAGETASKLTWNWSVGLTLSWALFSGGTTTGQLQQARATLWSLQEQLELLKQQVGLAVDQALLGIKSAKEVQTAAKEALYNANELFRLAEGRYQAGIGNMIELGDAQVALTSAAVQQVQADYVLACARAILIQTLGRF